MFGPEKIINADSFNLSNAPIAVLNGFLNAQKRTTVAAQATGHIVGQKLRLLNMRTVRLRVSGFNAGRISSIKGLVQSGTNVVCISDITTVDWHWAQRAKKPKRRN